jgi:hypothetical protein
MERVVLKVEATPEAPDEPKGGMDLRSIMRNRFGA